jgi:hypothetical protein
MAIVSIGYGDILLNADDAYVVFKLLCKAEMIEYRWSEKVWKRKERTEGGNASMKTFSMADYAALSLNSAD